MKKRIREGDYALWVVNADGHGETIDVTFRLMSGHRDTLGATVAKKFPRQGKEVWMLREMLEACGKVVPHAKVRINLDKLIGLECAGTITDTGDGKMEICAFFPVKDMEKKVIEGLWQLRQMELGHEMPRYIM